MIPHCLSLMSPHNLFQLMNFGNQPEAERRLRWRVVNQTANMVLVREPSKEFSASFKIRLNSITDMRLRRMAKLQHYHHRSNTILKSACLKFTTTKVVFVYVYAKLISFSQFIFEHTSFRVTCKSIRPS